MPTCPMCKGFKTIGCPACDVKVRTNSFFVMNIGASNCSICKGYRYIDCTSCGGLGYIWIQSISDNIFSKKGSLNIGVRMCTCARCNDKKRIVCPKCDGLRINFAFPFFGSWNCKYCNASGLIDCPECIEQQYAAQE